MLSSNRLKAAIWLAVPIWLAGCGLTGPCDHQRGIVLYAAVDGSDVRQADQTDPLSMVAFWEHQRDGFRRDVLWTILSPSPRGNVTEVHLHAGSAASGGGTLLYTFPIENARSDIQPPNWSGGAVDQVTSGSVQAFGDGEPGPWYRGTISIEDLMQRLFQGPTYLEVHTDSVPAGEFRAQLGTPLFFLPPDNPAVWQSVYCD